MTMSDDFKNSCSKRTSSKTSYLKLAQHPLQRCVLGLMLLLPALHSYADGQEGKPAPAITGKLADGSAFSLANDNGDVVIVNMWASWCGFCKAEMPVLEHYYQQHKKEGLKIYAVSMDKPRDSQAAMDIIKKYSFTPVFYRDVNMKDYGEIWHTPMVFVIDRQGVLRYNDSLGNPKITPADLEKSVTPLLVKHD